MTERQIKVSILIASIGRPTLAHTVSSAHAAGRRLGEPFEIVVADDSLDDSVRRVLAAADAMYPEVLVVPSGARNIASARNVSVEHSRGEFLAFVDDDEWVGEDWLLRHFEVLDESGADATFGPVKAHYPPEADRWVVWGDPLTKSPGPSRWKVDRMSTSNCLARRAVFFGRDLRFDEALGRSGGEDADLFSRLRKAGGRLAVAPDARIDEAISLDRCSAGDLWRRSLRMGQTYARREMSGASGSRRFRFLFGALARTAVTLAASIGFILLGRRRGVPLMIKSWINMGKVRELLNLSLIQYY